MAEGSESIFAQAKIEKSWLLWISLLARLYASWLAIRWLVWSVKWKALPLASFPEVWVTPGNCLFSKPTALNISILSTRLGSIKESTQQHQKQQQQQQNLQQNVKEIRDFFNSSVFVVEVHRRPYWKGPFRIAGFYWKHLSFTLTIWKLHRAKLSDFVIHLSTPTKLYWLHCSRDIIQKKKRTE